MTPVLQTSHFAQEHQWHQVFMDTIVTIELPCEVPIAECEDSVARAFGWFAYVEAICSRFDSQSELRALCAQPGVPVRVSPLLYQLIDFATSVARASRGAFDPSGGARMQRMGFDRNYADGRRVQAEPGRDNTSYRDILLERDRLTVTLRRPLILDLGAVAKGLAMDLCLEELAAFESCAINAGGDILVKGAGPTKTGWRIGIRHPRDLDGLIAIIRASDMAVCTSGDYERPSATVEGGHHIIDPRSGCSPGEVISATVIAPTAMAADALSTAAFVLGPEQGLEFVRRQGAECLIVTSVLETHCTPGFEAYRL